MKELSGGGGGNMKKWICKGNAGVEWGRVGGNMKKWICKWNAGVEWGRRGEYEEVEM